MKRNNWLTNNNPEPVIPTSGLSKHLFARIKDNPNLDMLLYFNKNNTLKKTVCINYVSPQPLREIDKICVIDWQTHKVRWIQHGKVGGWESYDSKAIIKIENISTKTFTIRKDPISELYTYIKSDTGDFYTLETEHQPSGISITHPDPDVQRFLQQQLTQETATRIIEQSTREFITTGEVVPWQTVPWHTTNPEVIVSQDARDPTRLNVTARIMPTNNIDMTSIDMRIADDGTMSIDQRRAAIERNIRESLHGYVGQRNTPELEARIHASIARIIQQQSDY